MAFSAEGDFSADERHAAHDEIDADGLAIRGRERGVAGRLLRGRACEQPALGDGKSVAKNRSRAAADVVRAA